MILRNFYQSRTEILPFLFQMGLFVFLMAQVFIDLPLSIHKQMHTKWLFLFGLSILSFLALFCHRRLELPKLSKLSGGLLAVIILYKTADYIFRSHGFVLVQFLTICTFVILTLSFFQIIKSQFLKIEELLLPIFLVNTIFVLSCLWSFIHKNDLFGNFGNINISVEFVGLVTILQIAYLIKSQKLSHAVFHLFGLSVSFYYIFLASSRSVYLGVLLGALALFLVYRQERKKFLKHAFIAVSMACLIPMTHYLVPFNGNGNQIIFLTPDIIKSTSTTTRYNLLLSSLSLIKEKPLGIGNGHFEFAITPYLHTMMPEFNESVIPDHPHNEYMRVFVEEGIPLTLLLMGFIIVMIYERRKDLREAMQKFPILLGGIIFCLIQAAFQFPLSNGVTFFLICLLLGAILAKAYPSDSYTFQLPRWVSVFLVIGYGTLASCYAASEYLSFYDERAIFRNKWAIRFNQRNWIAAINLAEIYMERGYYKLAQHTLEHELSWRPHNFVALRLLAQTKLHLGDKFAACNSFKQYDDYFNQMSSYRAYYEDVCLGSVSK